MAKRKAGLHKGLSEILNGVTIPKENTSAPPGSRLAGTPPSEISPPEPRNYNPPKPLTKDPQVQLSTTPQPSAESPPGGSPTSSPTSSMAGGDTGQASSPAPKSPPPAWSLPKIMPPQAVDKLRQQQAKGVGITRIFKQIPWQIFHARASRS